jgi:histidinol dehydrogenase
VRTLSFASGRFDADLAAFCRGAEVPRRISESVSAILASVRTAGDAAVARHALRFDGARLSPREFRVKAREIAAAPSLISPSRRRVLAAAYASIVDFNRKVLPRGWSARNRHGALVGEKFDAIRRVGIYVPGGHVPLVSTVLMTATLAKLAGCPEIAVFTPVGPDKAVAPALLAALRLVGIDEVYRVGGVQAIAAMAYGTRAIPAVDKVFGPGSAYVCEAKRQVFGAVGVDLLPGPSEVMIIADGTARADFAAADLLAQAEHGSGRERIYLVATSRRVLGAIAAQVQAQLGLLANPGPARRVVRDGFLAILVADLGEAAEVANRVAPEHLEILVRGGAVRGLVTGITTAGAIMVGNATPTALGDFVAGPSHVLPTAGAGRFSGGLRVEDFLRRTSVVRYDGKSVRRAARTVMAFSEMERLEAHGRSVALRVPGPGRR